MLAVPDGDGSVNVARWFGERKAFPRKYEANFGCLWIPLIAELSSN
jgi:hypothetical protein